jgi:putative ABC transport system ATP-binding protein
MPIPIRRPVEPMPQGTPAALAGLREPLIQLRDVSKSFVRGGETLTILSGLNISIERGSFAALMGPSGSGKSTLLNIIAGLDRPTSGVVEIGGARMDQMSEGKLGQWRADNIGFIYQQYNLIPVMTAIENVELPLLLTKVKRSERRQRARTALRIVGLEERMGHFPRQLSGGQEQRVAIARAIVNDPAILVADEPTGDLDRQAADDILVVLEKLARELGKTIVMVTHDPAAAARAFVQHRLDKGTVSTR